MCAERRARTRASRLASNLIAGLLAALLIFWLVLGDSTARFSGELNADATPAAFPALLLDGASLVALDNGCGSGIDISAAQELYSRREGPAPEALLLLTLDYGLGPLARRGTALALCGASLTDAGPAAWCRVPNVRDLAERELSFESDQRVAAAYGQALRGLELSIECPAGSACTYSGSARLHTWLPKGLARQRAERYFECVLTELGRRAALSAAP